MPSSFINNLLAGDFEAKIVLGIFWGVFLLLMTIISVVSGGYATQMLTLMADIYPGYEISYVGALVGLLYGFIDGLIACYIFAWLYNLIAAKTK
jgi:hypothetical protein